MPGRCAIRLSLHVERKDQRKVAQETEGGGVPAMQRESKGGSVCISKIERRGASKAGRRRSLVLDSRIPCPCPHQRRSILRHHTYTRHIGGSLVDFNLCIYFCCASCWAHDLDNEAHLSPQHKAPLLDTY